VIFTITIFTKLEIKLPAGTKKVCVIVSTWMVLGLAKSTEMKVSSVPYRPGHGLETQEILNYTEDLKHTPKTITPSHIFCK
jgi:hypothetical protein